jgi:hypothetical protein
MNEFHDHPTESLSNGNLRLEYLTDVGPRIVRLFVGGSEVNLLADLPEFGVDTLYGRFQFMGGHRLWHSPEALSRTYVPDQPVTVEILPDGVCLSAFTEPGSGIAKSIHICLSPDRASAMIQHEIRNDGLWDVELAPWALTMFRLSGVAILPQPVANVDSMEVTPNRQLVLWPYTRVRDERLWLADDFILFEAEAAMPPCKIGYYNPHGWIGYWLDGVLFVKRYNHHPGAHFPDYGCNTELYCNDNFVELETLGPVVRLAPGETVSHEETWEFYDNLDQSFIPVSLRQRLQE